MATPTAFLPGQAPFWTSYCPLELELALISWMLVSSLLDSYQREWIERERANCERGREREIEREWIESRERREKEMRNYGGEGREMRKMYIYIYIYMIT